MSEQPIEFFEGKALELGQAIAAGDHAKVEQLSQLEEIDLNTIHKKDMTFGHFALLHQDAESLKILTQQGASPHIDLGGIGSVMFCAIKAKETKFLEALLDGGADPNAKDGNEMPVFFHALTKDDNAALEVFIKHGVDLNLTNKTGRPATVQAFDRNKYDQVEFLIKAGIDLTIADKQGVTLAHALAYKLQQQKADKSTPAYQKLVELKQLLEQRGISLPSSGPQ